MRSSALNPEIDEITGDVVAAAIRVHKALGPGLLERAYREALVHALRDKGREVEAEVPVHVMFEGHQLGRAFRIDLLVDGTVVVELKSVLQILDIHEAQVHTYLRLTDKPVALLLNFNVRAMREGIRRFVHTAPRPPRPLC